MEDPDVISVLCGEQAILPSIQYTTFFLGRESLLPEARAGMARWRERLFAFMVRNALPATAFYRLPPDQVMEVGMQIKL